MMGVVLVVITNLCACYACYRYGNVRGYSDGLDKAMEIIKENRKERV
jgi:hypothetical protein|tara:strand:- start:13739 stop:13879 length:141 start_codon:yes stop_codon:yes gene_type:complete